MQTIDFLSRIVAEDEPDPNGWQQCDLCGHITKAKDGKWLNCGMFVCNWCRHAEMNFDVRPKKGDDVTAKE
jgi:hypothetical protein